MPPVPCRIHCSMYLEMQLSHSLKAMRMNFVIICAKTWGQCSWCLADDCHSHIRWVFVPHEHVVTWHCWGHQATAVGIKWFTKTAQNAPAPNFKALLQAWSRITSRQECFPEWRRSSFSCNTHIQRVICSRWLPAFHKLCCICYKLQGLMSSRLGFCGGRLNASEILNC